MEPEIILDLARVAAIRGRAALLRDERDRRLAQAEELAREALNVAEHCEYRLREAEVHNMLAEVYLDMGERQRARQEAEAAQHYALCGLQPGLEEYYYRPAYAQAAALLEKCAH